MVRVLRKDYDIYIILISIFILYIIYIFFYYDDIIKKKFLYYLLHVSMFSPVPALMVLSRVLRSSVLQVYIYTHALFVQYTCTIHMEYISV